MDAIINPLTFQGPIPQLGYRFRVKTKYIVNYSTGSITFRNDYYLVQFKKLQQYFKSLTIVLISLEMKVSKQPIIAIFTLFQSNQKNCEC